MKLGPLHVSGGGLRYKVGRWWIPDGLHIWIGSRGVHLWWRSSPHWPGHVHFERVYDDDV